MLQVYVVGGIVDRNRHKGCSAARASDLGITAVKLPVSEYIKLQAAQVLTVNQARRLTLLALLVQEYKYWRDLLALLVQEYKH